MAASRSLLAFLLVVLPHISSAASPLRPLVDVGKEAAGNTFPVAGNWTLAGGNGDLGLAFSPDGKWLATSSKPQRRGNKPPQLWALEAGSPPVLRYVLNDTLWQHHHIPPWARAFEPGNGFLAFSSDSKWLVAHKVTSKPATSKDACGAPLEMETLLYDLQGGSLPVLQHTFGPYKYNSEFSLEIVFSPDLKWLAILQVDSCDDPLWNWELYSLEAAAPPTLQARSLGNKSQNPPVFSGDSKWFAAAATFDFSTSKVFGGQLFSLEAGAATLQYSRACSEQVCGDSFAFSEDSQWLVAFDSYRGDPYSWASYAVFALEVGQSPSLQLSPSANETSPDVVISGDSNWLVAVSQQSESSHQHTLKLFHLEDGQRPKSTLELTEKGQGFDTYAFSSDSKLLTLIDGLSGKMRLYDLTAGSPPALQSTLDDALVSDDGVLFAGDSQWALVRHCEGKHPKDCSDCPNTSASIYALEQDHVKSLYTLHKIGDTMVQGRFTADSKWLASNYGGYSLPSGIKVYALKVNSPPTLWSTFPSTALASATFSGDSKWLASVNGEDPDGSVSLRKTRKGMVHVYELPMLPGDIIIV